MVSKKQQQINLKRERKRIKREKIDKATNQYMINLAWGILVIILLRFVETWYNKDYFRTVENMKIYAAVFGVLAIGLIACGIANIKKKRSAFIGYGAFSIVLALGSLWIGYFADVRLFFGSIYPKALSLESHWWYSTGPIMVVIAYLVVTLILTTIKVAMIEKGKKQ